MKICPDQFYQLFTLHALITSTIIPLAYSLLINKSVKDCNTFLQKILEHDDFRPESRPNISQRYYVCFNEFSLLISVSLIGCLFHFGQSVWRHVQNNGLSKKCQEDDDFRSNIKK